MALKTRNLKDVLTLALIIGCFISTAPPYAYSSTDDNLSRAQLLAKLRKLEAIDKNNKAHYPGTSAVLISSAPSRKATANTQSTQTAPPPYGTFLLRKDNLEASDILFQNTLQQNSDSKGANFTWTNNYIQKTNNITTQSYLTWALPLLYNDNAPRYYNPNALTIDNAVIAPFTYLNGGLTNPFNPKTERSAAQFGLNGEFALLSPPPFTLTTFSLLPYYQTDFRGQASIAGLQALVEPYNPQWHLGSQVTTGAPQIFDWYWRIIGDANPIWVDDAGLTSFNPHTTYGLLGGIGQLRGTLFANTPAVGKALCGRISVLGSFQPMWNVSDYNSVTKIGGHNYVTTVHGGYVNNVHAEVDYELAGKKSPVTEHCDGDASDPQDKTPKTFYEAQSFDASLSLSYDTGVDFSTYQKSNKFMLGLTLLY